MKKLMIALMMLAMATTGNAMSYEQARNEALFLTDKMAYELNLTDEQYEAAYEINLDYLMGVTSYDDVYGNYWERRNRDLSYVLLDWQWTTFCAATYFYRPLYWSDGFWHFGVYARYPHRDYFFFGRPVFYASYRGGHAWHVVGGYGFYYGRRHIYRPVGHAHHGMLDRWNAHHHHHGGLRGGGIRNNGGGVHHNGGSIHNNGVFHGGDGVRSGRSVSTFQDGSRSSSTRATVNNPRSISAEQRMQHSERAASINQSASRSFEGSRSSGSSRSFGSSESSFSRGSSRSFGGNGQSFSRGRSVSFGESQHRGGGVATGRSQGGGMGGHSRGSFGGHR